MHVIVQCIMKHNTPVTVFGLTEFIRTELCLLGPSLGSTGVLKTSGVPTWTVNFGVGEAHPKILLDAVLRGQPT